MASAVRDLGLDLDAFEGPFDLLLTLLLKDAIQPSEIDMAGIVVAFVERLAERDELDLDVCGEFLVLIAALLELKARHLFPDEEAELAELEPEEAAEELARRGVTTGCGGGNFCPQAAVSREQMAVFLLRTLDPALVPG